MVAETTQNRFHAEIKTDITTRDYNIRTYNWTTWTKQTPFIPYSLKINTVNLLCSRFLVSRNHLFRISWYRIHWNIYSHYARFVWMLLHINGMLKSSQWSKRFVLKCTENWWWRNTHPINNRSELKYSEKVHRTCSISFTICVIVYTNIIRYGIRSNLSYENELLLN